MSKIKITINDQEIDSLDQAIKLIQEAKEKKGLWRPENGQRYYYINSWGQINTEPWDGDELSDQVTFAFGNVFPTEAEAQKELDKRKALVRIKDYIAREGIRREKMEKVDIENLLLDIGFIVIDMKKIVKACESDIKILFEV